VTPGLQESSLTRVRPLFGPLLASESNDWLVKVLGTAPLSKGLPHDVLADPGEILPELRQNRPRKGRPPLARAFEYEVPPPTAFLRYLLTHPDALRWPRDGGKRRQFGRETTRCRRALIRGSAKAQTATIDKGIAELEKLGARGSRLKWWAFEGFTSVDCYLECERLVLLIEGKRNDVLSKSTDWYPQRNQLVRNLEVVGEIAAGRAAGVLLVTQEPCPELSENDYERSLPHLNERERHQVRERYLGQTTWQLLCKALGVDVETLPDETGELA
jgi:hypothetical protein